MNINEKNSKGATPRTSYRHTFRLAVLIIILVLAALLVRQILVPESFGLKGYYRASAVDEAREFPIRHVGEKACIECHDDIASLHDKDAHAAVPCESCHGPGADHAQAEGETAILIPEGKDPCLACHRPLDARPSAFPQIRWREHYQFVGVKDTSIDCIECHSPHEPLFMDRDIRSARLHPLIHRCQDCHTERFDRDFHRPKSHPAIFECSYCHKEIVEDFSRRAHSEIQCSTCHMFFKESDFAGRIIRDSDPRFCLLCHREADFRSSDAPPGIKWPGHLEDVAMEPGDTKKRCVDCHREMIHKIMERPDSNE